MSKVITTQNMVIDHTEPSFQEALDWMVGKTIKSIKVEKDELLIDFEDGSYVCIAVETDNPLWGEPLEISQYL